ncbi:MAG TPA: M15 family metallopeptidase [Casimicrobiaceae bacterium]
MSKPTRGRPDPEYRARVERALTELGIPAELIRRRRLSLCIEATTLVVVEFGARGRKHRLVPRAAGAWRRMKAAAAKAGVGLKIVSAFRSFPRQVEIIRRKIASGQSIDEILSVSAPPGYSEHHTGCAVDIGTAGCDELEEVFETSEAFAWLVRNAARYRYYMSYPRGNRYGYRYEPWHWRYRER